MDDREAVSNLGRLLKNIPYEHGKEYEKVFNLAHNTFFQKMIPFRIVECGFDMDPGKYFGLMVFLDYLTNVLLGDERALRNLKSIYDHLKRTNDDVKLDSTIVVLEASLSAKEIAMDYKRETGKDYFAECAAEIKGRYDQQDYVIQPGKPARSTDNYYNSIGLGIYNLFSDDNKEELRYVNSKGGLRALLFTDYAMVYLKDKNIRERVRENIKDRKYFEASLVAIDGLQREASTSVGEFEKRDG